MSEVLRTRALAVGYHARPLLRNIDLALHPGELVSLIGLNGSGKSTLIRTVAGLHPPVSGSIECGGMDLSRIPSAERARSISVVLTGRPPVGALDVHTLVSLGRHPWTGHLGALNEKDLRKVRDAMEKTGTTAHASRSIGSLSDGESQKVLIARALAQDTPIMVLDEPTAFLDLLNRVRIMRLLKDIVDTLGKTVLLSSHDLRTALSLSDRLLIIHDGRLWAGTPAAAMDEGIISAAFSLPGEPFDPDTLSLV